MDRKRIYSLLIAVMVTSFAVMLSSCTKDDDDDIDPDIPSLEGAWTAVYQLPFDGPMDVEADGLYLIFDDGTIEINSFYGADQVSGVSGTYEFDQEQGIADILFTSMWVDDDGEKGWVDIPEEHQMPQASEVSFSVDGDILYFTEPGLGTQQFVLHRCEPEPAPEMAGEWASAGILLTIDQNSNVVAASFGADEAGYIRKLDGVDGKDYLLVHLTSVDGEPLSDKKLFEYDFDAGEMVLTLTARDFTMVLMPLEAVDASLLDGTWIGVFSEPQSFFEDDMVDAMVYRFNDGELSQYSFRDSDQVAGMAGEYVFEYQGIFDLSVFAVFIQSSFDWHVDHSGIAEVTIPLYLAPDANSFTLKEPGGGTELLLEKVPESPAIHLEGTWALMDGETQLASFIVQDNGQFQYIQDGSEQSGLLLHLEGYQGEDYLLSSIVFCEFYSDGAVNYYTLNRYELNEADGELTLWHGEDVMVLTLLD